MNWQKHDYDDIPGTYVFDGKTSHSAYGLNKLLFSFNHAENRQAFECDAMAYAEKFNVTEAQKSALLAKDYLELLRLGANIYYFAKLAVPRGLTMQDAGAAFQGITTEQFKQNLLDRAEGFEQKLEAAGGYWHG